jgi:hypothetical protein
VAAYSSHWEKGNEEIKITKKKMQLFISEYELWYLSLCKKKKKGKERKRTKHEKYDYTP